MKKIDIPAKFPIPFANNAGGPFITPTPTESQIGIAPGRASLTDGFVPVNMQPIPAGGIPPFGQDMNGILNRSTSWDRWLSVGGPVYYDAGFATDAGGYPAEAIIRSAIVPGKLWMSTVDDNVSNPDSFGAGWVEPPFGFRTGDVLGNIFPNDVPAGWTVARAGFTIGSAGSLAAFASAMAVFLYVKTWNNFSNATCPVTGGRGANALSDFNAQKPIQVYDLSGSSMVGADATTGRLSGVPVVFGSIGTVGSMIGENLHALSANENGLHAHTATSSNQSANHQHSVSGNTNGMNGANPHNHSTVGRTGAAQVQQGTSYVDVWDGRGFTETTSSANIEHTHFVSLLSGIESAVHNHGITVNNSGLGSGHNTVGRSSVVEWMQKL